MTLRVNFKHCVGNQKHDCCVVRICDPELITSFYDPVEPDKSVIAVMSIKDTTAIIKADKKYTFKIGFLDWTIMCHGQHIEYHWTVYESFTMVLISGTTYEGKIKPKLHDFVISFETLGLELDLALDQIKS